MPLFFLLSGFCLVLGYGKKEFKSYSVCFPPCQCDSESSCQIQNDTNQESFNSGIFFKNRIIRVFPIYYICLLLGAILIPLGHSHAAPYDIGQSIGGTVASLLFLQTYILVFGFGPNPPAWTIATLWQFYLHFPALLVFAQKRSNKTLSIMMALSFYVQLIIGFALMFTIPDSWGLLNYWISTAHPLSRGFVFFMGICAGVLCVRIQNGDLDALQSKK